MVVLISYGTLLLTAVTLGSVVCLPIILLLSRDRLWAAAVAQDERAEATGCWIAVRRSTWSVTGLATVLLVSGSYLGISFGVTYALAGYLGLAFVAILAALRGRQQAVVIQALVRDGATLFIAHSFNARRPERLVEPTVDVARAQVTIEGVDPASCGGCRDAGASCPQGTVTLRGVLERSPLVERAPRNDERIRRAPSNLDLICRAVH